MLAARVQGLGTVLTTFNMRIEDVIRREFDLPSDAKPVAVIPVGWPDGERFGPTTRRPVEDVTHWDGWNATRSRQTQLPLYAASAGLALTKRLPLDTGDA